MKSLFEQIGEDTLAEMHGFESHSDRVKSLIGSKVKVVKCFEGEGHEGKTGTISGIDGDFHIVDFEGGDWCMATEFESSAT